MFVLSWIKFFRGYVYVHLTGYATERFLNLCGSRNILIWNLTNLTSKKGPYHYLKIEFNMALSFVLLSAVTLKNSYFNFPQKNISFYTISYT